MFRTVAPAGTPITTKDLGNWMRNFLWNGESLETFAHELTARFGVRRSFFVSTGRAALTIILKALGALAPGRTEVVIPSYTCFSVPASVSKAGLRVRICDVDPASLGYDLEKLTRTKFDRVLCIVTSNLYGIPDALPEIEEIARNNRVFLVDDAAQCLGGQVNGRYSGTFGDAGLFSLDKGKNLTTMEGGIIAANTEKVDPPIEGIVRALPGQAPVRRATNIAKLLAYSAFLHPNLYWIPDRIKPFHLGTTIYSEDFPIESYSPVLGALGLALLSNFETITETRIRNAGYIREALRSTSGVTVPSPGRNGARPVYARLPILFRNRETRDDALWRLNGVGIAASGSYPASVRDIPGIAGLAADTGERDSETGRFVAERILTVPTHPYVRRDDLDTIVGILKALN